jgi:hypothetical protein
MQPPTRSRCGCSLCTWHAVRRIGWRVVRVRHSKSWIASDMPSEALCQWSAVGSHCGHNDSPTSVSRCPDLLILVPKGPRAWCAVPCAILASEESLLVPVWQQRHIRAASPRASNRFSNSLRRATPMRRSLEVCSFRSGPLRNHVSAILIKLGTDSRRGAAKEARRLGLTPHHESPVAAKSK